jgi:microcystin-dependent protein
MGQDIQKGTIYAEGGVGGAGTVNADNLNAHVDEARIKASFISGKSLRDPGTLSDSIVVEADGVLYRETFQQVIDLINQAIRLPIGVIVDFAGTNPPGGWLMCFGQLVSRTTYSDLFDVIGTTWSAGDGSSTFGIPDLRGRVVAGRDDMGGTAAGRLTSSYLTNPTIVGGAGGTEAYILQTGHLPAHTHTASSSGATQINTTTIEGGTTQGLQGGGSFAGRVMIQRGSNEWGVAVTTTVNASTGGGSGHGNVQPTAIVNKIIRYQ